MCAPSDKFLNMGGPLAMGLGVVLISSVGKQIRSLPALCNCGAFVYRIY